VLGSLDEGIEKCSSSSLMDICLEVQLHLYFSLLRWCL
jgi:hypothetical protein